MSGGRRKSKNPQKWEESVDEDEQPSMNSFELNRTESIEANKSNQENYQNYNAFSDTTMFDNKEEKYSHKLNLKMNHRKRFEGSSDKEFEAKGANEGEMTVLDVLQGSRKSSRQGLMAECKTCSIQLKDWTSTVSHIRSHRLVYIPVCVKSIANAKQPATCMLCQKVCQNMSVLAFHAHTEHSQVKPPFLCPFCSIAYPSSGLFQKHMDIRDVCMKCPVCSATYNQEYELYAHLSDCLPTFHPHLKSLTCHVCSKKISMPCLAEHMIEHSVGGHEVRPAAPRRKPASQYRETSARTKVKPPFQRPQSSLFLCEICDGRFNCFEDFRKHLFDHTETKMYCPMCYLKGFDRVEWIVRHLVLRCPRRTPQQFEFGAVISIIGKERKLNFLQVLKDIHHLKPFREGLLTWASIPLVHELLKAVEVLRKEEIPAQGKESPTDIQLLILLSEFEREMQKHQAGHWDEFGAGRKESSKSVVEGGGREGKESECQLLMENIGKGADRTRCIKETRESVVSAHAHAHAHAEDPSLPPMPMRPALPGEDARTAHQLPLEPVARLSASEIRAQFPGATFVHNVTDVARLQALFKEAVGRKDSVPPVVPPGSALTSHDFVRLEWEAQYLRTKEPFYLRSRENRRRFSPLYRNSRNPFSPFSSSRRNKDDDIDPETVKRMNLFLEEESAAAARERRPAWWDQERLDSLLREAKEC